MLDIDTAIKHCLEVAEKEEQFCVQDDRSCLFQKSHAECAADHRQLAEWLTELKEWKENPFLQIRTECRKNYYCNNCTFINHCPFAKWLTELREAKRLLKAAVEDMHIEDMCDVCVKRIPNSPIRCPDGSNCFVWRYKDEALKLIES